MSDARVSPRGPGGGRTRWTSGIVPILLLGAGLIAGTARAADRKGPVLIGALTESWGPSPSMVGLRDGLVELGYRENEQFVIGVRFTQGDLTALPAAARELVQQGANIIFTSGPAAARAARMATTQVPIVFGGGGADPVAQGLVQSFARPGGNVTGVADLNIELAPKRLELFREIIQGLKQVLFAFHGTDAHEARAYREAARRLAIMLVEKPVRTQEEAQATLAQIRKGEVDGILAPRSVSFNIPGLVLETASKLAIPTMFHDPWYVEQGGLASYGSSLYETGRQAARLVDKILKGAKPAGIPVEVNPKIEFAINVKAARTLGLAIAPEVLYRVDRLVR